MSKLIKGPPGSLRRKTVEKVERVDRDDDEDLMEVADEDDEEVKASFEEQVRGRVFQLNAAFFNADIIFARFESTKLFWLYHKKLFNK
jgi:hypothetical protein